MISKSGKPVARLVPWAQDKKDRIPGQDKRLVHFPEDFDAPLPPELLATFES